MLKHYYLLDIKPVYLKQYQNVPQNENDIIIYLYHCCIIKDGINEVCKMLKIGVKQTKILLKYTISSPINQPKEEYKGDDKFFEYLRSLFFAHPFLTDRSIPNPIKNEIQYSPYTLNITFSLLDDMKNAIFCFEVTGAINHAKHYQSHMEKVLK